MFRVALEKVSYSHSISFLVLVRSPKAQTEATVAHVSKGLNPKYACCNQF